MYVLTVGRPNGDLTMYGPFPSVKRAEMYAEAVIKSEPQVRCRYYVKELIVPFSVVKNIVYRNASDRSESHGHTVT